jgi:hypothetical protein
LNFLLSAALPPFDRKNLAMTGKWLIFWASGMFLHSLCASPAAAQRISPSGPAPAASISGVPTANMPQTWGGSAPPLSGQGYSGPPPTAPPLAPSWQPSGAAPPAGFDPYANSGLSNQPILGGVSGLPPSAAPPPAFNGYGAPNYGANPYAAPGTGYGNPYPTGAPPYGFQDPNWGAAAWPTQPTQRFITNLTLKHLWIEGDAGNELDINDTELSTTLNLFNIVPFATQPLRVTPGFILHLWAGPDEPTTADLPPRAYSGFIGFHFHTSPDRPLQGEINFRPGVYTDFETLDTDSFRFPGYGLIKYQLTERLQLKGGLEYLDRLQIQMLPAGGVLWTPSPQTRFDIYFPRPKLAQYFTTLGNQDLWWYVGGEYGGGSWTIQRDSGMTDRVDYNDIRVFLGIEFGPAQRMANADPIGFFEGGFVFRREVIYAENPGDNFEPNESFMLRAGVSY